MSTLARPQDTSYAPPEAPPAIGTGARCLDCATPLVGDYCHVCGALRADERPLTVARFAGELANEVTSVDSATLGTLRALFREPGRLTADYVAGRVRRYLSPLRVYLLLWSLLAAFTAASGVAGHFREVANAGVSAGQRAKLDSISAQLHGGAKPAVGNRVADNVGTKLSEYAFSPWLRLFDPFAVGALVALLFRGRRRSYAEHFVFALHVMAFNAALSIVTLSLHIALHWRAPVDALASVVHWTAIGTYFFLAARRVHGESKTRTGFKAIGFVVGAQLAEMVVPVFVVVAATAQALLF